jgi:hypothetical protein
VRYERELWIEIGQSLFLLDKKQSCVKLDLPDLELYLLGQSLFLLDKKQNCVKLDLPKLELYLSGQSLFHLT